MQNFLAAHIVSPIGQHLLSWWLNYIVYDILAISHFNLWFILTLLNKKWLKILNNTTAIIGIFFDPFKINLKQQWIGTFGMAIIYLLECTKTWSKERCHWFNFQSKTILKCNFPIKIFQQLLKMYYYFWYILDTF